VDFTVVPVFTAVPASTARQIHMHSPAPTRARSAALTMEAPPEAFPLAGSRVLVVEASTAAGAFMEVVVDANSINCHKRRLMIGEKVMVTKNMNLEALETSTLKLAYGFGSTGLILFLLGLLLFAGFAKSSLGQDAPSKTFSSPAEASQALFQAAQTGDEQRLEAILGGKEVTSSSDEEEDKLEREQFNQKYQEMHRLVQEPDSTTVLYIGAENWPFPVPLVSKNGEWYFDSERGKREILFRRIGENETTAIQVCEEFAMAKNAADAKADSEDPITRFAQSLAVADAANTENTNSNPFHGYYFRIVARNASSDMSGRGTKGLTLIAYPAEYQSSGVKTFVVTHREVVFEKDLGPNTTTLAPQMKARTGSSWHPAE
jgi:Protein of unknown function (DUF2950)